MRLTDKGILVTGAASGMGRVATKMFTEQGAKGIATDINAESLEQTVAEAGEDHRASILPLMGNVVESSDVKGWVEQGVNHFGKINVLYNNAGIMPDDDTSVLETSEETWERIMDVNLKGVYLC